MKTLGLADPAVRVMTSRTTNQGRTIPSRGFVKLKMSLKEPRMRAGGIAAGGRERLGGNNLFARARELD